VRERINTNKYGYAKLPSMADESALQQSDTNKGCSGCGDGCGDGCSAGTQKIFLIIAGLFAVVCIIAIATSPGFWDDGPSSSAGAKATSATAAPTIVKQVSFEEKLESEINKANQMSGSVEIESVTYNEQTKGVVIWLFQEHVWDEKNLRNCLAYTTFDIMGVLVKYPEKIDFVTIAGKTPMIDSKGHTSIDKVYQVETTMDDAKTVNWGNLIGYNKDVTIAIKNNFEYAWWHTAIRP
jgi:hypothetical protein